ncbi:hypothetical protein BCR15_10305 [Tessaracoccus lapidicaptus]|uniref:Exonuclease domain-containing protein n=1 Tax=Tessaracoccus lapidicaptus TaxID=1427523 RepID=A0A1C0AGN0_9ACTN|nr:exonuclease domain-containing protein [Tessaracoccus lapidicaptus]OCL30859.1 hypothetical protein BCR15_10305 [Tessaracoccus lapidicaptus]
MAGYTVIDFETTGLSPRYGDRIVEIGVVKVSHEGEVYDAWSTLVNPQRDVGASRIHGITAKDVLTAPTFDDVAPALLDAVAGRIVAAHNASFDMRFLAAELERVGYVVGERTPPSVCTMRWSGAFLPGSSRRLRDCCASAGIEIVGEHSALADAFATAQLLASYLDRCGGRPMWGDEISAARAFRWPAPRPAAHTLTYKVRADRQPERADGWLDRIVARMPRSADSRVDSYLAVLEMAMLDGYLSLHEQDQLVEAAQSSVLSRPQVLALHAEYLHAMAAVALEDGILTADERSELDRAAACLGLAQHDVDDALAGAAGDDGADGLVISGISLTVGDRVTFTGEMRMERSVWEARARAVGLQPAGLARSTKLLVAADPDSLSGKASKARSYGVPIVDEAAFAKLMDRLEASAD